MHVNKVGQTVWLSRKVPDLPEFAFAGNLLD